MSTVWPLERLWTPPRTYPAPEYGAEGVESVFMQGLPWAQGETRHLAHFALPHAPAGTPVPGMVLVHGGGGAVFPEWVRMWAARGYAAIAMDWYGAVPGEGKPETRRHQWTCPWAPGFGEALEAPQNQWPYHAASAVLLAHSLLRSLPGVDAGRIGVTGISWGGYLTSLVAGLDPRFSFAVPVYGCGFLADGSAWVPDFERIGPEKAGRWLNLWDPKQYLPRAKIPMLWVNGTNDFAYTPRMTRESARLNQGPNRFCMRVRMPHSHKDGWSAPEIAAFADSMSRQGAPLARIARWQPGQPGGTAAIDYESQVPVIRAEMHYTCDAGAWQERKWETAPGEVDTHARRAQADVPRNATAWYMNLTDEREFLSGVEVAEAND